MPRFARYFFVPLPCLLPSLFAVSCMRKTILLYGIAMAVLVGVLKYFEYSFFVKDLSAEMYIGAIAVLFTVLGIWAGRKLTRTKVIVTDPNFVLDPHRLDQIGISKREYEVLELIAQGMSNQEIAEKLFVSLPTVKTHSSNLFLKLNVRRRTEAIKKAKELMLLP
jgi:NarL family two-component system response regulator LiaR